MSETAKIIPIRPCVDQPRRTPAEQKVKKCTGPGDTPAVVKVPLVASCTCSAPTAVSKGQLVCARCDGPIYASLPMPASSEWIPASASPLGKRKTLQLARDGELESSKIGKAVLVRRLDVERYISDRTRPIREDEDLFGAVAA